MLGFGKNTTHYMYYIYKAYLKMQAQFRRTKFGMLWDPLSLLIVSTMIALCWSVILGEKDFRDFYAHVLSGQLVWMMISAMVSSGTGIFLSNRDSILNEYQPLYTYCIDHILLYAMRFLLVLPLVILISIFLGQFFVLHNIFTFVIAFFCIVLFGSGVSLILGSMAMFIKDIKFLISSIMRLAFLLTPIIWKPERLGEYQEYLLLNPFYPLLESCRSALIHEQVDSTLLIIGVIESIVVFCIGIFTVKKFENPIRIHAFRL